MVDASFSLWRSAFLTDVSRDRKIVFEHMKEFVRKVLEQNAITFADDHRLRALAVGYYNANARYRIERLYENHPELLDIPAVAKVSELSGRDLAKEDQAVLWDFYFNALEQTFDWFESSWIKVMRPGNAKKQDPNVVGDSKAEQHPSQ
ncbi:hypothetical protein ACQR1H_14300 [Bradyrhizobium sp. HKCCYLRH2015]|uniref:hypothetical protein n=1 Tax=Bradyrhizobium sp. HKCCYLRH2015 TaxID=3420742 RepID=UPI003EBA1D5F